MLASRRRGQEGGELSILPVMNLVSILIPFLLMTTQFVELAGIDTLVPALASPGEAPPEDEEALTLVLLLTSRGVTVLGADAVVYPSGAPPEPPRERAPTLPCAGGACASAASYDWRGLTALLARVKDAWPEEEELLLVPDADLPYELVVRAMDASREDPSARGLDGRPRRLFPKVVLASGVL